MSIVEQVEQVANPTPEPIVTTTRIPTESLIYFDIETAPLPDEQLAAQMPIFDESTVACGNLKDPAKIAAKLKDARQQWYDRAALDPLLGRVAAIGYCGNYEESFCMRCGVESELIIEFWHVYRDAAKRGSRFVGHNILGFDLPFLVRRSWVLGIDVPDSLLQFRGGRPLFNSDAFIDTMALWSCGLYGDRYASLDAIARGMGVGAKNGNGGDFYKLLATDVRAAAEYLKNDLRLVRAVAGRIGF